MHRGREVLHSWGCMRTPRLAPRGASDDMKALGVVNGLEQLLLQSSLRLILGEEQVVEARVRRG